MNVADMSQRDKDFLKDVIKDIPWLIEDAHLSIQKDEEFAKYTKNALVE